MCSFAPSDVQKKSFFMNNELPLCLNLLVSKINADFYILFWEEYVFFIQCGG